MNFTLITGASKGIGKAIAVEAAKRKMNLLLVARSKDLLEKLAQELSATGVVIKTFTVDLHHDNAAQKVFQFAKEQDLNINMLVNNAGMGFYGKFTECDLNKHMEVMKLNMDAQVRMAYEFLKHTDSSQRRYILNTVSTGAYQPVPAMTVYAATKAFMLFFSRGLREELKRKNVYVTALCPGPTESEFFVPAQMTQIVEKNSHFMMGADRVAKVGLNAVLKNKSVAIPGITNKIGAVASKLIPHDIVTPLAGGFFK